MNNFEHRVLRIELIILFAGFVARMKDTRLPKCAMFGELVGGTGCVGGQEKEWMGCNGKSLSWTGLTREWWCCTLWVW